MKPTPPKQTRERLIHLERVLWIDQQVRSNHYPNARTIAWHFEVTTKTAQRTLDLMRDRLRLPLGYSSEHRGWYYTEPAYALPAIELTEGDLVAILLAEKHSRQYRGTAIGKQVEQAFSKVLSAMTNTVSIDLAAFAEAHSFEASASTDLDPDLFRRLGRAAIERRRIEMTYFTAARGELTRRRCDPLHLRNRLGEWYVIAFDHLRNEVRDFNASRIRELTVTDERFEWPCGFDLNAYLDSGFGMFRGSKPYEVEIEFDEYQSRWIRERAPFHPTEEREELLVVPPSGGISGGHGLPPEGGTTNASLPETRLRIRMTVTALDGVKRFVMQYGSHARVLAPEELRDEIREEIDAMSSLYADVCGQALRKSKSTGHLKG